MDSGSKFRRTIPQPGVFTNESTIVYQAT
ncbi:hypothetical protein PSAB6_340114 [Paraburkholderia sabiae]|nr:hypothetical protein PSAB6_340114 [Paraburkholderia sabiae]